ncbi:hypothetical protein [Allosphingosinicella vermicomposti]|uniref:hypothetical protein n=1 Tax=Allosphingosinicella vermicomposti TaxID=614671 RepID=UPI000D104594|nr:hypothetical protein [Allosphingosinicella vermicomposti]
MAGSRPYHRPPGATQQDRDQARKAMLDRRQALTAKLAEAAARRAANAVAPPPCEPELPSRDVEGYMAAIASQPLHRLGEAEVAELTPTYATLVRSAAEIAGRGDVRVVMPWPPSKVSPSAIVSLLAIGAIGSAARASVRVQGIDIVSRERADEVRAMVFPYARSSHAQARQVQVDRHDLGRTNFEHVARYLGSGGDAAKDLHQVLARVRRLSGRASDGRDYAEFEHPILDEIIPHGPARGDRPANSSVLWRTRTKTDIGRQTRSGEADDPAKAAYYMFTVRRDDRLGVELRAIERPLDLLILDLSRNGRDRLGWDWVRRAGEMATCMREIHPSAGILAVVDDPWSYRAVRFDVLGTKQPGKKGKVIPAPGSVIYCPTTGILQDVGQRTPPFEGASSIAVDGFYGDVDSNIEHLRELANRLADMGDPAGAATARNLMGTVRRSASLPGSIAELSRFIERETSAAIADDRLATYRATADISTLTDPTSLASQADAEKGVAAETRAVMRTLEQATPMATLIEDAMQPALRSSSRSVFVFRSDMIAEFAVDRLGPSHPKLAERIESGVIRFGGARALDIVADAPPSARNQFKRAIFVAPTTSTILATLAEPWLPEQVVFLADADTLAFAARDASRLADEIGVDALAARLRTFAQKANSRVAGIGRHTVQLDAEAPSEDVEFPTGSVVDLTGGGRGERRLVEIKLGNGQRVIARSSTGMVLRDDGAATTTFVERPASQIKRGDEVCVIGAGFIERARSLVNIRATAAEEIREYHSQVAKRFAAIPEESTSGRLRVLVARMGQPAVPIERARYWIDLRDEIDKPLHEVVPHAPQDRDTFMRFTEALGIGQKLAESFWLWAVVAQRSHRMRAGNVFHDAFRGILTDPHAALASNRDRSADIRALRAMAEEHVATVADTRSIEAL